MQSRRLTLLCGVALGLAVGCADPAPSGTLSPSSPPDDVVASNGGQTPEDAASSVESPDPGPASPDVPAGSTDVTPSTPPPGRCRSDADCGAQEHCVGGSARDPGGGNPDGVCAPDEGCAAVQPEWVEEICNAASVVVFDGTQCVSTCPGCCGCQPFCDLVYPTVEECEASCEAAAVPLPDPQCPRFAGATAACSYTWDADAICHEAKCLDAPCASDADCPAPGGRDTATTCVQGNCVDCQTDSQCPGGAFCRAGRCVFAPPQCPEVGSCDAPGCTLATLSEAPCPTCVCDTIFDKPCANDLTCQSLSVHPYSSCVFGRCAECRYDGECPGRRCVAPGRCADLAPDALYGTWLVGWSGGLDHYSYLRFEPDGTLRRGRYDPQNAFSDDVPPPPCWPDDGLPPGAPRLGTWVVESDDPLEIRLTVNAACDPAQGYDRRFGLSFAPGGEPRFQALDDGVSYVAVRVPANACLPDLSTCISPDFDWFGW